MKLMNALSEQVEPVVRPSQPTVKIFTCGPTVYDFIHLGNARPLILTDIIVRALRQQGYTVDYAQNITDIDDKIIKKARQENVSEEQLATTYKNHYLQNISDLNLVRPDLIQPISAIIPEQISFISKLIEQGDAYVKAGNVFFNVNNYLHTKPYYYGQLAKRKLNFNQINHQKNDSQYKISNLDFALWKKSDHGVNFVAPWSRSKGRPGWHTECAVVNALHFKEATIDIHIGGIDLKFPHHENERIQYLAAFKKDLSRIWIYNGHLEFNNLKMSKSIGNIIYVHNFIKQYSSDVLRIIFYDSAYNKPLQLTDDIIRVASITVKKIKAVNDQIKAFHLKTDNHSDSKQEWVNQTLAYLNANLNTANVMTLIFKMIKNIKKQITNQTLDYNLIQQWRIIIFDILGLTLN